MVTMQKRGEETDRNGTAENAIKIRYEEGAGTESRQAAMLHKESPNKADGQGLQIKVHGRVWRWLTQATAEGAVVVE